MRWTIAIATIMGAHLLASPPPEASPEKMLEAAIYQAKVLGNMPAAIRQLDTIATEYAGRPVAARALVEMGQAEQQLGHTDRARGAYSRVLKDYRDQVQLVAQVRQNLATMTDATVGPRNLSFEQGDVGKVPEGWFVPQSLAKEGYSAELRRTGCRSTLGCVVVMVPTIQPARMFGNLMQSFPADGYRGKTVRLHAWLRVESVAKGDNAEMWFRVDKQNRKMGFFDNMMDRPVESAAWTEVQIVGRIDDDAQSINIGVMSHGAGRAWVDSMTFEIVADNTPTTGVPLPPSAPADMPKAPVNLTFEAGTSGKVPTGWFAAVGKVEGERQGCRGAACASVWLPEGSSAPFGNIMQQLSAANYRGKTVRIRAWLRLDATTPDDSAQMWFRVDRPNKKMGGFDNMDDRPVKSALWVPAEIVAKVDTDAEVLNIGVMSGGKGRAWVDGMSFEVVPDGTPATGKYGKSGFAVPATVRNLDFADGQIGKVPDGWFSPIGHAALSHQGCHGSACVVIWLEPDNRKYTFGNLMQTVSAAPYRGKTVRMRGWLRLDAADKDDKAQMWFRVDLPEQKLGAFDNMDGRPVQSATWTAAEIVAKVAADAETLNFGAISIGKGRAWVDGITLEVVSDGTPSTGIHQLKN